MPCATLRKAIPSSRSRAAPPRPSGRLTARALEPLAEERNRAFRDYVEAFYNGGDEAKGIELARRVDEKAGLIRDFKIAYVREHPASAVSLAIVQELCDRQSRLDRAQMESLMDALAPQARESAAGRYAAACIRDKRIVEGQPLPDLELPGCGGRRAPGVGFHPSGTLHAGRNLGFVVHALPG